MGRQTPVNMESWTTVSIHIFTKIANCPQTWSRKRRKHGLIHTLATVSNIVGFGAGI